MRLAALIPCRDEAAVLPALLPAIRREVETILVIDDGSQDRTAAAAIAAGARCLRFSVGRGKGAALQAGFKRLLEWGFTHAVTLDGDGQHAPSDIPCLMEAARGSGADLVVGRRAGVGMPWIRRAVNHLMSACLSWAAGKELPDSQCGFRLVNLERMRQVTWRARHFEFESEMLIAFARRGWNIQFVPVRTIYRREQSKIRPLPDTLRWLRWYATVIKTSFDTGGVQPYNASGLKSVFRPTTRKVKIYGH